MKIRLGFVSNSSSSSFVVGPQLTEPMPKTFTLRVADSYRRGCPYNRKKQRAGYGVTSKGALNSFEPHANQAPYFIRRTHPVVLVDRPVSIASEDIAWQALGWVKDHPQGGQVIELLKERKYASAAEQAALLGFLL